HAPPASTRPNRAAPPQPVPQRPSSNKPSPFRLNPHPGGAKHPPPARSTIPIFLTRVCARCAPTSTQVVSRRAVLGDEVVVHGPVAVDRRSDVARGHVARTAFEQPRRLAGRQKLRDHLALL